MSAIEASGVSKRFGAVAALVDLSMRVEGGTIFGILGPNGAGKSTLLRILCGIERADSGTVCLLGRHLPAQARDAHRRIGYVSQEPALYDDLTVHENLQFFAEAYGQYGAEARASIDAGITALNLRDWLGAIAGTLSRGWQQRVSLACAMLHRPSLLLLDEPTAGLDPLARRETWELLRDAAARGVAVLLTTHHMDEAERCDHIAYMNRGRVLLSGGPRDLAAFCQSGQLEDALIAALHGTGA